MTTQTAPTTTRSALIGTWELQSFELRKDDGTTVHPLGTDVVGRLTYDAEGRMAVQVMRPGRPEFASGDMLQGSARDVRAAWDGFIAYAGRWDQDPQAGTVTHQIEISSFPNWVGDSQVRFATLADDVLTLATGPLAYGGAGSVAALVWRRA